jgi:hypothetical protein
MIAPNRFSGPYHTRRDRIFLTLRYFRAPRRYRFGDQIELSLTRAFSISFDTYVNWVSLITRVAVEDA